MADGALRGSVGGGVPAGVDEAVAENEPMAAAAAVWNEGVAREEEALRTKVGGGGMAEAIVAFRWG